MDDALHRAVVSGDVERVTALLDDGTAIDARNAEGRTALHDAIEHGVWPAVELLLERGAYVDVCAAAILGRTSRLRRLLDADPSLVDDRSTGLSPLGWAAYGNRTDSAALLIDRGARMDDGELLCAASVGHVDVGRLLIDRGAVPDAVFGERGLAAIHAAAAMRYTDDSRAFVTMLVERGADVNLASAEGLTALGIAETGARRQAADGTRPGRRFDELAALLRAHGARTGPPAG